MSAQSTDSIRRPALRRWATLLALNAIAWSLVAIFFSSESYLASAYRQQPIAWASSLGYSFAFYSIWMLLTPLVIAIAARFDWEHGRRLRFFAAHVPASFLVSLLQAWLFVLAFGRYYTPPGASAVTGMLVAHLHSNLLIYWLLVGGALAFEFYRRYRERALRASQLEARLAQASLQLLKMQLQPHFLFNTLNSISALVREEPDKAERMVADLGSLLRRTLDNGDLQEVPLRDELATLDLYLDIERTRFAERLRVRTDIDPATLDALVPNMVLQPLVENAIRHGVGTRVAGGAITIEARRQADMLSIRVSHDGPGLGAAGNERGIGLDNTRARLARLHGERQSVELAGAAEGGLAVTLRLPLLNARVAVMDD